MMTFFRGPEFNADISSDSADDHLPVSIINFISWKLRWIIMMVMVVALMAMTVAMTLTMMLRLDLFNPQRAVGQFFDPLQGLLVKIAY